MSAGETVDSKPAAKMSFRLPPSVAVPLNPAARAAHLEGAQAP